MKDIKSVLEEMSDNELLDVFREAHLWDGSFDFVDVFDFEELAGMTNDTYEFGRSIVYGNVTNIIDPVRYNAYGNLESVSENELELDARDNVDDLADWLEDNYMYIDGYDFSECFEDEEEEEDNE